VRLEPPKFLAAAAHQTGDNALHGQELARMLPSMTGHLVGLSEIASMLGVTRQRASQLVRDYDDFPPPVAELAAGRVWDTAAVEAWAKAHPERPPGRRVKEWGQGS